MSKVAFSVKFTPAQKPKTASAKSFSGQQAQGSVVGSSEREIADRIILLSADQPGPDEYLSYANA